MKYNKESQSKTPLEVRMQGDGDCSLVSLTVTLIAAFLEGELDNAIEEGFYDGLLDKLNQNYLFSGEIPSLPMGNLEEKKQVFSAFLEKYSNFNIDDPSVRYAEGNGHLSYWVGKLNKSGKNLDSTQVKALRADDPLFPPIAILTGIFRSEIVENIQDPKDPLVNSLIEYHFGEHGQIPTQRLPAAFGQYERLRREGWGHVQALEKLKKTEEDTFYRIEGIANFFKDIYKAGSSQLEEPVRPQSFIQYWNETGKEIYLTAIGTPQHWLSSFPELQVLGRKYRFRITCVGVNINDNDENNLNWPNLTWKFEGDHYNPVPHRGGYAKFLELSKNRILPFYGDKNKKPYRPESKKIKSKKKIHEISRKPNKTNVTPHEIKAPDISPEKRLELQQKARELLEQQRNAVENIQVNTQRADKGKIIAYWIGIACLILLTMVLCFEMVFVLPAFAWLLFVVVPGGGFGLLNLVAAIGVFFHVQNKEKGSENTLAQKQQKDILKVAIYWVGALCVFLLSAIVFAELFFFLFPAILPLLIIAAGVGLLEILGWVTVFTYLNKKKGFFDRKKALPNEAERNQIKNNFLFEEVHSEDSGLEDFYQAFEKILVEEVFSRTGQPRFSASLAAYLFRLRLGGQEELRIREDYFNGNKEVYKLLARGAETEWVHALIRSLVPKKTENGALGEHSVPEKEKARGQKRLLVHLVDMINCTLKYPVEMEDRLVTRELVLSYFSAILNSQEELLPYIFQRIEELSSRARLISFLLDEREPQGWSNYSQGKDYLVFRNDCFRLLCMSSGPSVFNEKELYNFTFNILKASDETKGEAQFFLLYKILSTQIQALEDGGSGVSTSLVAAILSAYEDYCLVYLDDYAPFKFFEYLEECLEEKADAVLDQCKNTPLGGFYSAAREKIYRHLSLNELIRQHEKAPELFHKFLKSLLKLELYESNSPEDGPKGKLKLLTKLLAKFDEEAFRAQYPEEEFLEIKFLLLDEILTLLKETPGLLNLLNLESFAQLIIQCLKNLEGFKQPEKIERLYDQMVSLFKEAEKRSDFEAIFLEVQNVYTTILYPAVKDPDELKKLLGVRGMAYDLINEPLTDDGLTLILLNAFEAYPDKQSCLCAVQLLLNYYRDEGKILSLGGYDAPPELTNKFIDYYQLFVMLGMYLNECDVNLSATENSIIYELIKRYLKEYFDKTGISDGDEEVLRDLLIEEMLKNEHFYNKKVLYFFERALYDLGRLELEAKGLSSGLQIFIKEIEKPESDSDNFIFAAMEFLKKCKESELFQFWIIFVNVLGDKISAGDLSIDVIRQMPENIKNLERKPGFKNKIRQSFQEVAVLWEFEGDLENTAKKEIRFLLMQNDKNPIHFEKVSIAKINPEFKPESDKESEKERDFKKQTLTANIRLFSEVSKMLGAELMQVLDACQELFIQQNDIYPGLFRDHEIRNELKKIHLEFKTSKPFEGQAIEQARILFEDLFQGDIKELWEDFFSSKNEDTLEFQKLCCVVQLKYSDPHEENLDEVLFEWFKRFLCELDSEKVPVEQELTIHRLMRQYAEQYWLKSWQETLNYFLRTPRESGANAGESFEYLERTYPDESTYFHFRARSLFMSDEGEMDMDAVVEEIKKMILKPKPVFFSPTLSQEESRLLERFLEMTFDWAKDLETKGKKENLMDTTGVDTMKMIYTKVRESVKETKSYALGNLDEAYRKLIPTQEWPLAIRSMRVSIANATS